MVGKIAEVCDLGYIEGEGVFTPTRCRHGIVSATRQSTQSNRIHNRNTFSFKFYQTVCLKTVEQPGDNFANRSELTR